MLLTSDMHACRHRCSTQGCWACSLTHCTQDVLGDAAGHQTHKCEARSYNGCELLTCEGGGGGGGSAGERVVGCRAAFAKGCWRSWPETGVKGPLAGLSVSAMSAVVRGGLSAKLRL